MSRASRLVNGIDGGIHEITVESMPSFARRGEPTEVDVERLADDAAALYGEHGELLHPWTVHLLD
jgi:hypothetical protein